MARTLRGAFSLSISIIETLERFRFRQHEELLRDRPPGPAWKYDFALYGINTILASSANGSFPLRQFCDDASWAPVYLDTTSAIFVRQSPENEPLIERLRIKCDDVALPADTKEEWGNAALILEELERYPEALAAVRKAQELGASDAFSHVVAGEILLVTGDLSEAEREFQTAVKIKPEPGSCMGLAQIAHRQGRVEDEIEAPTAAELAEEGPAFKAAAAVAEAATGAAQWLTIA
jgi:tetratricopeptide (TPR) repeat protein